MAVKKDLIVFSDFSVVIGNQPIINSLSLSIKENAIFGLIGVNGAGKTTLIKSLLGLRNEYKGSINVAGDDARNDKIREKIFFLPEKFEPPISLTGFEFIKHALSFHQKFSQKTLFEKKRVLKIAKQFVMSEEILNKKIKTYSKGMRQKIGLMTAMLSECPILVLDEPMSGLDPLMRYQVKQSLLQAHKEKRTIFFTSHILADIQDLCDHVALIHNQKLFFDGEVKEFLQQSKQKQMEKAFLTTIEAIRA